MNTRHFLKSAFLFSTLQIIVSFALPVDAQSQITLQSKVAMSGIGAIKVGMTVDEASRAANTQIVTESGGTQGCSYGRFKGGKLKGLSFMLSNGNITRVDVNSRGISTIKGAKVGDSEDKVKSLYAGQMTVDKLQYSQRGHTLTVTPKNKADQKYLLIFETDGKRVTKFRSGFKSDVEATEGCI
jgi:hypothetical protein